MNMAIPSEKAPEIANFLNEMFDRDGHIEADICVACKKDASTFRNAISTKEYSISGLCQVCQDKTFGVD
jgi:hypothetical protein